MLLYFLSVFLSVWHLVFDLLPSFNPLRGGHRPPPFSPPPHSAFPLLLWGGWWERVGSRGRSFGGGTARAQCVLPRVLRALFRGRHSAQSMRATSAAPCSGKSTFLEQGRRDAFCDSPRLWVPGRFQDRSLPRNDPCAVLQGRVGRGERTLTPRTRDDIHHTPHPHSVSSVE